MQPGRTDEPAAQRTAITIASRSASRLLALKIGLAAFAALLGVLFIVGLYVASAPGAPAASAEQCSLTGTSAKAIPANYLPWLTRAAARYELGSRGFGIVAAIHKVESDFGRSNLPGVHSGTNYAGAAGPGQFLASTWASYGIDADEDGLRDPYSVPDSVFATANYLHASGAPADWPAAIFAYNHSNTYVHKVESEAAQLGGRVLCTPTPATVLSGPAALRKAQTLYTPRDFEPIPSRYWAGAGPPEAVDSRIWPDVVWVLQSFNLRAVAARESGHQTHGDGTAVDLVPASGQGWDQTARKAAEALGWRESCGASGTAPVCPLVPAIQFIGYNGYPGHGDPAHAGSSAHLHISWQGASFGCGELCPPPRWVRAFPLSS